MVSGPLMAFCDTASSTSSAPISQPAEWSVSLRLAFLSLREADISADAILQRHHLLLSLPARSKDC